MDVSGKDQTQTHEPEAPKHQAPEQTGQGWDGMSQTMVDPAAALQRAAAAPPPAVNPNDILSLQRAAGNRAVQRLIAQRKAIGPSTGPIIQAKLSVNPPGDRYEQEADHMASQVMQRISTSQSPSVQRQEEELQTKTIASVQRQEEEEEELQTKPADSIQRAATDAVPEVDSGIENQINSARGGGESLPENVRGQMEQGFGADFSGVRVHTDSDSDGLNQSLQARAFTTGQDIFFKSGQYDPGSSSGQQLLAHELTHTIQQGGAPSAEHVQREDENTPSQPESAPDGTIQRDLTVLQKAKFTGPRSKKAPAPPKKKVEFTGPRDKKAPPPPAKKTRFTGPRSKKAPAPPIPQVVPTSGQKQAPGPIVPTFMRDKPPLPPTTPPTIGALPSNASDLSASSFQKKTRLTGWWLGRKGESDEFFSKLVGYLKKYESTSSTTAGVTLLKQALEKIEFWDRGEESSRAKYVSELEIHLATEIHRLILNKVQQGLQDYVMLTWASVAGQLSHLHVLRDMMREAESGLVSTQMGTSQLRKSRHDGLADRIEIYLEDEIDRLLMESSDTSGWFQKTTEESFEAEVVGGKFNKLDLVHYQFGITMTNGKLKQVIGGEKQFSGYFRSRKRKKREAWGLGIFDRDPGFHRRNIAMYRLDQLLGSNVIPPTFLARHGGKIGAITEGVETKNLSGEGATPEQKAQIHVQQSLSNLYLLDLIAGQVDRHSGNILFEMKNGVVKGVKGIDLDLAFGKNFTGKTIAEWNNKLARIKAKETTKPQEYKDEWHNAIIHGLETWTWGKMPVQLEEIDQTFAQSIITHAYEKEPDVRDVLAGFISQAEIESTISRLKKLADILRPMIGRQDGPVISGSKY